MKYNLGCGFDVKEGWFNTNHAAHEPVEGAMILDARDDHPDMVGKFDFILINHVLCTMPYNDVRKVLKNVYDWLSPGGTVQVVEMDMIKAVYAFVNKQEDMLPIEDGNLDWKFCMHVSGYSTRPSIFTPHVMKQFLIEAGFNKLSIKQDSEYDTRPKESLIVEAVK